MDGARFFSLGCLLYFFFLGEVGMLVRATALYAQWGCVLLLFSTLFILRDYILASHPSSVPFFCSTSFLSLSLFHFMTSSICVLHACFDLVVCINLIIDIIVFREIGRSTI